MSVADGSAGEEVPCPSCDTSITVPIPFTTSSAGRRPGALQRPRPVSLLAAYSLVQGLLAIAVAVFPPQFSRNLVPQSLMAPVFIAIGVISIACAVGLLRLRPWSRMLAIALAALGLLAIPLGTIVSILILVYLFRPDVKLLFSGKTSPDLTNDERELLAEPPGMFDQVLSGCLLVVVVLGGIAIVTTVAASLAVPRLESAIDAARQERSMVDLQLLGAAVDAYQVDNERYPPGAETVADLQLFLVPDYLHRVPTSDGWGRPLTVTSAVDGSWVEIASLGADGQPDDRPGGPTTDPDADIVYRNGRFWQWPEGLEPE